MTKNTDLTARLNALPVGFGTLEDLTTLLACKQAHYTELKAITPKEERFDKRFTNARDGINALKELISEVKENYGSTAQGIIKGYYLGECIWQCQPSATKYLDACEQLLAYKASQRLHAAPAEEPATPDRPLLNRITRLFWARRPAAARMGSAVS